MTRKRSRKKPPDLDALFIALADQTRRAILSRLAKGDASVAELTQLFEISQPAISKHLTMLERAGLIEREKEGARRLARLLAQPMTDGMKWMKAFEPFWAESFAPTDEMVDQILGRTSKRQDTRKPKP